MAIVWGSSYAYHSDDDSSNAGRSEQFVRDGWWSGTLGGGNAPTYFPTGGPFGNGMWSHGRYANEYSYMRLPSAIGPTFMFAVWARHNGSNANAWWTRFYNTASLMGEIYVSDGGAISYQRGSTTLGTSSSNITYGRWHHLALKVLIHDSTGTVDLTLDGQNVLSLTGQDTYEGTSGAEILDFRLAADDNTALTFSQPILWSAVGDAPTDLFGQHRIWALRPNGDSATVDWTPKGAGDNYVEVDEAEADDDTTYNEAGTSADEDRLDCEALPETPTAIYAVQPRVLVKQTAPGNLGLKVGTYSGTTKTVSAERKCGLNYDYHSTLQTLNPDDSAAWSEADVNACQLVYEVG